WEGQPWDDIPRSKIDAWAADITDYAPPGGETARQLMQRVQDFLLDLEKLPEQHIALVTHAGSIRAILAQLADVPLTDTLNWKIAYGTVIGVKFAPSLKQMTDKR
ncbi:MAG: alpha-ribazole phosphatase, partial [Gallionellales bacterium CG17_big_fil_post_rev_8_21_14_2_50_54_146]